MTDDEVNELVNRASRASAQEAIAQLETAGLSNRRAYVSFDNPPTLISVILAITALVLWAITSETAVLNKDIVNMKETDTQIKEHMDRQFDKIDAQLDNIVKLLGK